MLTITKLAAKAKPAPAKSYKRKVDAQSAAVATLGENARSGYEFTTVKCDGVWFWDATDPSQIPPPSAAEVKIEGKKAAKAKSGQPVTMANGPAPALASTVEPVSVPAATETPPEPQNDLTAALALVMTTAPKPLAPVPAAVKAPKAKVAEIASTAPDPDFDFVDEPTPADKAPDKSDGLDIPDFLKRTSTEAEKEAVRAKLKNTVGPDRKITNPPSIKQAREMAAKARGASFSSVIQAALLAGKTNTKALADLKSAFPTCPYKESDVQWYRRRLVKAGKLKA